MEEKNFDKLFVETWLKAVHEGKKANWIGEELRVSPKYVLNKAQTLRKHGVKLPALSVGRYSITKDHVDDLNSLINSKEE